MSNTNSCPVGSAEEDAETQGLTATKILHRAKDRDAETVVKAAVDATAVFQEKLHVLLKRAQKQEVAALGAVHEACIAIHADKALYDEVLADGGVKPHGNSSNPFQPLIKAFLQDLPTTKDSDITRWSAVMFWFAQTETTTAEGFAKRLQHVGGIKAAYEEAKSWRRSEAKKEISPKHESREFVEQNRFREFTKDFKPITLPDHAGLAGRRNYSLALVRHNADGAAEIVQIVEEDDKLAWRYAQRAARKQEGVGSAAHA